MVQIFCTQCGHRHELEPAPLWQAFVRRGWPTHLRRAEKQFTCSICKAKAAHIYPGKFVPAETGMERAD